MGEIVFILIVALMCLAAFGLIAYMLYRWAIRHGRRMTLRWIALGGIATGIGGITTALLAPVPSQVGELLFFVFATEILAMLALLAASFHESRDDELNRMIADDL